jgi:hypothetical protein
MRALLVLAVLVAGCSQAPPQAAEVEDSTPDGEGPVVERVLLPVTAILPVDWDGETKEGAWVCTEQDGVGACPAGQQIQPDGRHVLVVPYETNLTTLDVNMTWTPAPGQTGLVLAAYGNTTGGRGLLGFVRGASPLGLRIEVTDLVSDNALVLMVWPEGKTATSPSIFVDATRQAYHVEGTLTTTDQVWTEQRANVTASMT